MLLKRRRQVLHIFLSIVLLIMIFGVMPGHASAATQNYQLVRGDWMYGSTQEKVGDYFVWRDYDLDYSSGKEYLKCAKSFKTKAKVLKTIGSGKMIGDIVTNGNYIYYTVSGNNLDGKCTIYRTNVKGGAAKQIKTIKEKITGEGALATYYNGRIYYYLDDGSLRSCNVTTKSTRTECKKFNAAEGYIDSGNGKYITAGNKLYNVATKKMVKLPSERNTTAIYGNRVYWETYSSNYTCLKSCNLSGKDVKTVKKFSNTAKKEMQCLYLGYRYSYFENIKSWKAEYVKVMHSTGKTTKIADIHA